jgi:hypothetical protein
MLVVDDWAFVDQPPKLSAEQKKQQEKEDYDKLHALVLSRITNKEDLNQPLADSIGEQKLLHKTCVCGDAYLPMTQLLISHGADTNVRNYHNSTPLHYAVNENALETVMLLLNSKAQPDISDKMFGTPLLGMCTRSHDILYDEIIAKKRGRIAQLLLKYGANPNAKNEFQNSCLHGVIATPFEYLNSIDSLKNRNKALFFSQRKALIRALLLYGATLNAKNSYGKTAIQQAYEPDNSKNQPYLIELSNYALSYSGYLRTRLLYILGHSGSHQKHETPFKALPKDIVNYIIDYTYPAYNGPQITRVPKTS